MKSLEVGGIYWCNVLSCVEYMLWQALNLVKQWRKIRKSTTAAHPDAIHLGGKNDESGRHEWVIPEPAMHVSVGVAMAISWQAANCATRIRCDSRWTGIGTQGVPNTMQRNATSQLIHGSSSTGMCHTWLELLVLDDNTILRGRCLMIL